MLIMQEEPADTKANMQYPHSLAGAYTINLNGKTDRQEDMLHMVYVRFVVIFFFFYLFL